MCNQVKKSLGRPTIGASRHFVGELRFTRFTAVLLCGSHNAIINKIQTGKKLVSSNEIYRLSSECAPNINCECE